MKNLICAAIALSLLLPAVASARPGDTGFVVTSRKYNERENYAAICHEEFGIHARVADFADIRDLIRRDPYMRDFIEDTGLQAFKSSALLHFRGQKWGPRGEPYYIQKRDHKRSRRTEGIIDQIGDGLFELKVRKNNAKPIMCFIPHEHRREAPRVRLPLTPPPPPVLREPPPPPPPPPPPAR
ncbi:MAG TPA: hypothetical protein PKH54_08065, partial [Myxococcota bacterium]|nr:hypothetical protein [Myxococcota bacterium]